MSITINYLPHQPNNFRTTYHGVNIMKKQVRTVVTHCPDEVDAWVLRVQQSNPELNKTSIVGLRTEYLFSTPKHVVLLQLCVEEDCLLFQLGHTSGVPNSLVDFLKNPEITFVGVGDHAQKLSDMGLRVGHSEDAKDLAAKKLGNEGIKMEGLKFLARAVLKLDIEQTKEVTMSAWESQWLTEEQVKYATVAAFVSYQLGKKLHSLCSVESKKEDSYTYVPEYGSYVKF